MYGGLNPLLGGDFDGVLSHAGAEGFGGAGAAEGDGVDGGDFAGGGLGNLGGAHISLVLECHELAYGDELESAAEELIEGLRHGVDGGLVDVVGEKDAAGTGALDEAAGDYIDAGTLPVAGIDGPEDGGVAVFFEDPLLLCAFDGSVGWAEDGGGDVAGVDDGLVAAVELTANFRFGAFGEVGVGDGVISDFVAIGDHAAEEGGVVFGFAGDDEEGGGDVALFEDIEEAGGVAAGGAIIEGHCDVGAGDFGLGEGNLGVGAGLGDGDGFVFQGSIYFVAAGGGFFLFGFGDEFFAGRGIGFVWVADFFEIGGGVGFY